MTYMIKNFAFNFVLSPVWMWLNIWDIVVIEDATWIKTELLDTEWLTIELIDWLWLLCTQQCLPPGHMAGCALPKLQLPKSRKRRSQDLSYHYGGPCCPRPCQKLTSERNQVNLSIYIWAWKQVSIQSTDSKEGEGGEVEIIKMFTHNLQKFC